jgi:hypothetical protein
MSQILHTTECGELYTHTYGCIKISEVLRNILRNTSDLIQYLRSIKDLRYAYEKKEECEEFDPRCGEEFWDHPAY